MRSASETVVPGSRTTDSPFDSLAAGSGRPANSTGSGDPKQDGNTGNDRLAGYGRNAFLGPDYATMDLRVGRRIKLGAHLRLELMGEAFNVLNISNLSGRSSNLLAPGFGQPTSRVAQVFGSGGPRSFQLAARVSF